MLVGGKCSKTRRARHAPKIHRLNDTLEIASKAYDNCSTTRIVAVNENQETPPDHQSRDIFLFPVSDLVGELVESWHLGR